MNMGIQMRDYFAAKFAPKIIGPWANGSYFGPDQAAEVEKQAYQFADAMMLERNK